MKLKEYVYRILKGKRRSKACQEENDCDNVLSRDCSQSTNGFYYIDVCKSSRSLNEEYTRYMNSLFSKSISCPNCKARIVSRDRDKSQQSRESNVSQCSLITSISPDSGRCSDYGNRSGSTIESCHRNRIKTNPWICGPKVDDVLKKNFSCLCDTKQRRRRSSTVISNYKFKSHLPHSDSYPVSKIYYSDCNNSKFGPRNYINSNEYKHQHPSYRRLNSCPADCKTCSSFSPVNNDVNSSRSREIYALSQNRSFHYPLSHKNTSPFHKKTNFSDGPGLSQCLLDSSIEEHHQSNFILPLAIDIVGVERDNKNHSWEKNSCTSNENTTDSSINVPSQSINIKKAKGHLVKSKSMFTYDSLDRKVGLWIDECFDALHYEKMYPFSPRISTDEELRNDVYLCDTTNTSIPSPLQNGLEAKLVCERNMPLNEKTINMLKAESNCKVLRCHNCLYTSSKKDRLRNSKRISSASERKKQLASSKHCYSKSKSKDRMNDFSPGLNEENSKSNNLCAPEDSDSSFDLCVKNSDNILKMKTDSYGTNAHFCIGTCDNFLANARSRRDEFCRKKIVPFTHLNMEDSSLTVAVECPF